MVVPNYGGFVSTRLYRGSVTCFVKSPSMTRRPSEVHNSRAEAANSGLTSIPRAPLIWLGGKARDRAEKKDPVPIAGSRKRTASLLRKVCACLARLEANSGGVANWPNLLRSRGVFRRSRRTCSSCLCSSKRGVEMVAIAPSDAQFVEIRRSMLPYPVYALRRLIAEIGRVEIAA